MELVDIRHQQIRNKKRNGATVQEPCNRLCVRVSPGSKGEAYCPTCELNFSFDVVRDNQSIYDILNSEKPAMSGQTA